MRNVSLSRQVGVVCVMASICTAMSLSAVAEAEDFFLGVVDDGQFKLLAPSESPWSEVSLTSISMPESVPPETGQLVLQQFEGHVIVVRGYNGGGWIYSAGVVEIATPLIAQFILNLFPSPISPCAACLERLNTATRQNFEAIGQIEPVTSASLLAARPFDLSNCDSATDIEQLLDQVPDIGEVLRERIVRHFCPDLYE